MKKTSNVLSCVAVFMCSFMVFFGVGHALEIVLEPANAQREIGGKVRVHVYADNAVSIISMGVSVSFNPAVLQAASASKYEVDADTGWVMDADGSSATTGDQYRDPAIEIDNAGGSVTMIGGNLNGTSTAGHTGKVLLGWIVFNVVGNGNSNLSVDLANYHPNHPTDTFDNFVQADGTVSEPTNVPGDLGSICAVAGACNGDVNGNGFVDPLDFATVRGLLGTSFPSADYAPSADFNANGFIDPLDFATVRGELGSTCPSCP